MKADARIKKGDLVFHYGFTGVVPCRVKSITGPSGVPSTQQTVEITYTKTARGKRQGDTERVAGDFIAPRSHVTHTRSSGPRVRGIWTLVNDDDAQRETLASVH